MDTLIWLGVMMAAGVAVWSAAPHHQRLIIKRAITNEHAAQRLSQETLLTRTQPRATVDLL
jgi:hypothetical protein